MVVELQGRHLTAALMLSVLFHAAVLREWESAPPVELKLEPTPLVFALQQPEPVVEEPPPPPPGPIPEPPPPPEPPPVEKPPPPKPPPPKPKPVPKPKPKPKPVPKPQPKPVPQPAPKPVAPPPPAPPVAPPKPSAEAVRALRVRYEQQLFAWLNRAREYPIVAQRRRMEGRAVVLVTIDRQGRLISKSLAESTRHGLLNDAALKMVDRASPFPPVPAEYEGPRFVFRAPVDFRLR